MRPAAVSSRAVTVFEIHVLSEEVAVKLPAVKPETKFPFASLATIVTAPEPVPSAVDPRTTPEPVGDALAI